jgi:CubicO group peptidase (beta-lactamase class C family)
LRNRFIKKGLNLLYLPKNFSFDKIFKNYFDGIAKSTYCSMDRIDRYMQRAVLESIFPGAVLLVAHRGQVEFFQAYGWANLFTRAKMTVETVFDLASLTKPLATTLALMKLIADSKLSLNQTIGDLLPIDMNSDKALITIEMLLNHTSGYPAYRAYYKILSHLPKSKRKERLRSLLFDEPLLNPIGKTTLYSDLGFMLLAEVVEQMVKQDLDQWVLDNIYTPLDLTKLYFIKHFERRKSGSYAATEFCPFRHMLLSGIVHDDNAYAIGGVCGHAGLFGTAENVKKLLMVLLQGFKAGSDSTVFSSKLIRKFFKRSSKNGRPLGFDAPSFHQSASGTRFSKQSIGHLGFTGTSFWVDLKKEIIIILLTNRVHPHRHHNAIRYFRPWIHDAVMNVLEGE